MHGTQTSKGQCIIVFQIFPSTAFNANFQIIRYLVRLKVYEMIFRKAIALPHNTSQIIDGKKIPSLYTMSYGSVGLSPMNETDFSVFPARFGNRLREPHGKC